jgi:hypothetical protein
MLSTIRLSGEFLLMPRPRPKNKPVASVACSKVQKSFAKFALPGAIGR